MIFPPAPPQLAAQFGQHGLRALDRRVADHVGERDYPSTPHMEDGLLSG